MAKGRMFPTDLFEIEEYLELDDSSANIFMSMILAADDYGRGKAHYQLVANKANRSVEVVERALPLLEKAGFIQLYTVKERMYYFLCHWFKWQSISKPTPSQFPIPPGQEGKTISLKYEYEIIRVQQHLLRAKELDLPATLTSEQWFQTLNDFEWMCAYCGGLYEILEHFIPLSLGKGVYGAVGEGTTTNNCVPACASCNCTKKDAHPLTFGSGYSTQPRKQMFPAILRVQTYLENRGKSNG